ncbi:MAG TPA: glycosyltransferase family 1 protein [Ghiorsea sp.]|nr:glycosyltransferase family 1 protein [Ghiorsea sp.]HIP07535.1 glycosyltransferase family 1 protein [Mariprofundaceae bacterium]
MKILHLITRMDGGGSAVNTLLTSTEQARAGHDVTLVSGVSQESDMSDLEQSKVDAGITAFEALGGKVVVLENLKREVGLHDKRAVKDIRALGLDDFDIVHTHTSKAGALGRYAAANSSAKVVHTPHGHIFHGYFGKLKTEIFLKVEQHLAKKTDVLIALTNAERDDHLQLGVGRPEQWVVVPSGVDVEAIAEWMWEHPVSGAHKTWDVVSVGRLVPIKGMERLIQAWEIVVRQHPQAKLALVGDGEDKRSLEKLASRLNIIPNVEFVGWVDPLPELAKAKTFALMSHNEGMGRAVVEAMAAGLPCVVSDVCGLRELVDGSVGKVVDAEDAQAVAQALLTDWPRDIARNTRARADNYSVAAMMQGLDEVYQSLTTSENKT